MSVAKRSEATTVKPFRPPEASNAAAETPPPALLQPVRPTPKAGDAVLIIASEERAEKLCRALRSASGNGYAAHEVLDIASNGNGNGNGAGTPTARQIEEAVFEQGVSEIVVDPDIEGYDDIVPMLIACKLQGVRVRESQDFFTELNHKVWLEGMSVEWLLFSDGFCQPRAYQLAKRCFDVIAAVAMLIVSAPLLAGIAVAIKIDSRGPVLFRQDRVGRNGRIFTLYKFRSMYQDAEKHTGPVWASPDDDRVTRVGALLRKARLDELPQFVNVLRNDISFVGPRPERPCFVAELSEHIPFYRYRELLKPGITGWAQICKGYTDSIEGAHEKLEYDFYYAKHASFGFDLGILLRTVGVVLFGKGR